MPTTPAICPELFTATASGPFQPGGRGTIVLPEGLPTNTWGAPPLLPVPATCPESLMPYMVEFVNPLGGGITVTR